MNAQAKDFPFARIVYFLASLSRSLFANKVRDRSRHGLVETDHVEHATIVWVGESEAVGGHAYNDRLRVTDEFTAILTQCLRGMDIARLRFAVRAGDETHVPRPAEILTG